MAETQTRLSKEERMCLEAFARMESGRRIFRFPASPATQAYATKLFKRGLLESQLYDGQMAYRANDAGREAMKGAKS